MSIHRRAVAVVLSVFCLGADPVPSAAPSAPSSTLDEVPVTMLACVIGDSWTYRYATTFTNGAGLNGSETFTRTNCGDRPVLHPTGHLVKADVVGDADGNLFSGFSVFTGGAEHFTKPFPYYRLPLTTQESWDSPVEIDVTGDSLSGTGHWNTAGWETITVAAGTYTCLRKEFKMQFDYSNNLGTASGTYKETSWYCPAIRADAKSVSSDSFGDSGSHELTAVALK